METSEDDDAGPSSPGDRSETIGAGTGNLFCGVCSVCGRGLCGCALRLHDRSHALCRYDNSLSVPRNAVFGCPLGVTHGIKWPPKTAYLGH